MSLGEVLMTTSPPWSEANRRSWNAATAAHNRHKQGQGAFLEDGGSTLFAEELELLGDLGNRDLLHLLCNSGQDTLSLARHGARVTGVDLSDEAIQTARELAAEVSLPARFERADVFDWLDGARADGRRFDLAFASYGALCWLYDLARWMAGVAAVLRPGGRLVIVEFHPMAMALDEQRRLRFPYFSAGETVVTPEGIGDYVADAGGALAPSGFQEQEPFHNPHPSYEYAWGLADVVSAVLDAGLELETLREYPFSNGYKMYDDLVEKEHRRWYLPAGVPRLPLMFGLTARRAG